MKADEVFSNSKGLLLAGDVNSKAGNHWLILLTSDLGSEEPFAPDSREQWFTSASLCPLLPLFLPTLSPNQETETYVEIFILTEPFHNLYFYCLIRFYFHLECLFFVGAWQYDLFFVFPSGPWMKRKLSSGRDCQIRVQNTVKRCTVSSTKLAKSLFALLLVNK